MWTVADRNLESRLLLGTARYPSPKALGESIRRSGANVVTVSLRRETAAGGSGEGFWRHLREFDVTILPNTAGCRTVHEAVTTAHMARELFETPWIKLEVIGNEETLQPDPFGLVEAARILTDEGFHVFPYTTEDLIVCERLVEAGCSVLMPWGAPIGTGRGLANPGALKLLRERFPEIPLIVDAGIGRPSHAVEAMELGCDGVLLNTAVARSLDPPAMAQAFAEAIRAGRRGWEAGIMEEQQTASASTPLAGLAFSNPNLGP